MAEWRLEETIKETLKVREKIRSKGQDDRNFCLVPFTTIILEPDGQVGVCRHKGSDFPIGHITKNTISEIWNGETARKWRREFLEGKPEMCEMEVRHRHCQHCPENNKLLDYVEFSEIQTQPILKLTANFNGKCNLQCQMCDIWQKPNGLYDQINFWEPAKKEIFPFLKEVDLLSGEPFIQPDTYRLIDEIAEVNPECEWIFTTNVHWKMTDKIRGHLDKIKIKNIIFSVDSFKDDVYHKIRYPGKLPFVLENIDVFRSYNSDRMKSGKKDIRFILNFLVQKDNWSELPYAIEYSESRGIIPLMTFLYVPSEFSLLTLSENERMEIFEKLLASLTQKQTLRSMRVLMPLYDSFQKLNKAGALLLLKDKLGSWIDSYNHSA